MFDTEYLKQLLHGDNAARPHTLGELNAAVEYTVSQGLCATSVSVIAFAERECGLLLYFDTRDIQQYVQAVVSRKLEAWVHERPAAMMIIATRIKRRLQGLRGHNRNVFRERIVSLANGEILQRLVSGVDAARRYISVASRRRHLILVASEGKSSLLRARANAAIVAIPQVVRAVESILYLFLYICSNLKDTCEWLMKCGGLLKLARCIIAIAEHGSWQAGTWLSHSLQTSFTSADYRRLVGRHVTVFSAITCATLRVASLRGNEIAKSLKRTISRLDCAAVNYIVPYDADIDVTRVCRLIIPDASLTRYDARHHGRVAFYLYANVSLHALAKMPWFEGWREHVKSYFKWRSAFGDAAVRYLERCHIRVAKSLRDYASQSGMDYFLTHVYWHAVNLQRRARGAAARRRLRRSNRKRPAPASSDGAGPSKRALLGL